MISGSNHGGNHLQKINFRPKWNQSWNDNKKQSWNQYFDDPQKHRINPITRKKQNHPETMIPKLANNPETILKQQNSRFLKDPPKAGQYITEPNLLSFIEFDEEST